MAQLQPGQGMAGALILAGDLVDHYNHFINDFIKFDIKNDLICKFTSKIFQLRRIKYYTVCWYLNTENMEKSWPTCKKIMPSLV